MIGMPRITLISPALSTDSTPMPETRISAQTRPSTVDSSSEPMVTMIVSADAAHQDRQELDGVAPEAFHRQPSSVDQPCAFRPHLSRILSTVPLAFSFASEALILASSSRSPLRTPMPTEPTVTGL